MKGVESDKTETERLASTITKLGGNEEKVAGRGCKDILRRGGFVK